MAKNKMEDVAKLLGIELEEEFKIYGWDGFYKITELGLERYVKERSWLMDSIMLTDLIKGTAKIIKIPKPILTDKEKDYLSSVIKPFRNDVISIKKYNNGYSNYSCIVIEVKPFGIPKEFIDLPSFRSGTMYNGLEANREYTLGELGL